jgi:hypothetical protein
MLKKALAIALISVSSMASADLVSTDWQVDGDELATLHEETGIEWLDLNLTAGMSMEDVAAEMSVGGDYEGWRFPTASEVEGFLNYAFDGVVLNTSSGTNAYPRTSTPQYVDFVNLVGLTYTQDSRAHAIGQYEADDGSIDYGGVLGYTQSNEAFFRIGYSDSSVTYSNGIAAGGVYLVSDGGVTISSINNPELNAQNPNSPAALVPVPFVGMGAMVMSALLGGGLLRNRKK